MRPVDHIARDAIKAICEKPENRSDPFMFRRLWNQWRNGIIDMKQLKDGCYE